MCLLQQYGKDIFFGCVRPQSREQNYILIFTNLRILYLTGHVKAASTTDDVVGLFGTVVESVMGMSGPQNVHEVMWRDVAGFDTQAPFMVRVIGRDSKPKLLLATGSAGAAVTLLELLRRAKEETLWWN